MKFTNRRYRKILKCNSDVVHIFSYKRHKNILTHIKKSKIMHYENQLKQNRHNLAKL